MPCEPVRFIVDYVQTVAIEGRPIKSALPTLLKASEPLGLHTSIIHILDGVLFEYRFVDPGLQPNGHRLVFQCPSCLVLRPFKRSDGGTPTTPEVWKCKVCSTKIIYPRLPGFSNLKVENAKACWIVGSGDSLVLPAPTPVLEPTRKVPVKVKEAYSSK